MVSYITLTMGILREKCIICGYKLTRRFPEDFPDEWKMCCSCKSWAVELATGSRLNIEVYYCSRGASNFRMDKLARQLDKIEKKITLVR